MQATAVTAISPEFVNLKARLRRTWMAGDYDRFSRYMEGSARDFYERMNVAPGSQLLDVACGSGTLALMAARDSLYVTGVDIAGNLVERARARANAESLLAHFEEADAEALPFEDASFDVVVSLIGAMFAPRPDRVAQELLRVCSPGGTDRHGELDSGGIRWADVQGHIKIHSALWDALAAFMGKRSDRSRATRRGAIGAEPGPPLLHF